MQDEEAGPTLVEIECKAGELRVRHKRPKKPNSLMARGVEVDVYHIEGETMWAMIVEDR